MHEGVREQLDRIIASQALAGSDQLKRLLRTSVERSLQGQSELLKEYNLGLEVFQRPPDYDPKLDPIVRVQARRLRAKLEEYYAGEGAADPITITIPKGAYVPVFDARKPAPVPQRPRGLWIGLTVAAVILVAFTVLFATRHGAAAAPDPDRSVAVLPLKDFTERPGQVRLSDQATEMLTTSIARSKQLRVLSRTTASRYGQTNAALPDIASELGVRWIVEGGVGAEGSRVYLKLRVVDAQLDRKIWADVFDCETNEMMRVTSHAAVQMTAAIEKGLGEHR